MTAGSLQTGFEKSDSVTSGNSVRSKEGHVEPCLNSSMKQLPTHTTLHPQKGAFQRTWAHVLGLLTYTHVRKEL